ncbi:MAG: transporter substrate-binding domain-containing protein [Eubacterium sp.]|nr:transporter substrate-binding domain-containing protein [Eubacterium sp.]
MLSFSLAACGNADSSDKKTDTPSNDTADTVSDGNGTTASDNDADDNTAASDNTDTGSASDSDMAYVKDKGTLIVGITNFEPMDYQDADGNWIGFDADMAKAFAESIGVTAEFVEIDWDNKVMELDGKTIDCVWNGMTLVDEVTSTMECSNAYCNNAQVVIVPSDQADLYQDVDSLKELNFAVEAGSAGEAQAKANNFSYTPVQQQSSALMEVAAGTADAAIIDSLMAAAMVGDGTGYANLTYTIGLNNEEYGVGFRKGSDLAASLNDFFAASYADGSLTRCAETYGVQAGNRTVT